jgi:hypothetical protein
VTGNKALDQIVHVNKQTSFWCEFQMMQLIINTQLWIIYLQNRCRTIQKNTKNQHPPWLYSVATPMSTWQITQNERNGAQQECKYKRHVTRNIISIKNSDIKFAIVITMAAAGDYSNSKLTWRRTQSTDHQHHPRHHTITSKPPVRPFVAHHNSSYYGAFLNNEWLHT